MERSEDCARNGFSTRKARCGRTEEKGEAISEERAVQQALARYVRGTDARDGAAVAAVFTEDGRVDLL